MKLTSLKCSLCEIHGLIEYYHMKILSNLKRYYKQESLISIFNLHTCNGMNSVLIEDIKVTNVVHKAK